MSRSYSSGPGRSDAPRRDEKGYAQLNPIWRGVGCLLFVGIAVGSWFVADWLRLLNFRERWVPYLWDVPWYYQNLALALVLSLIIFAIITVLYGWIARPTMGDPLTVRGRPRRKPRKSR